MSSIMKLLRRIGSTKATPTSGDEGQLAVWKAGTAPTDATSVFFHDGAQWVEILDTAHKVVSVGTTAPSSPKTGDLWLNSTTSTLTAWNGSAWVATTAGAVTSSETAPATPANGALWFKPSTKELSAWDGAQWSHVAFTNVANTFTKPQTINVNETTAAFHIVQAGTGAAFVVDDEASPDATPFMITNDGNVNIGTTVTPTAYNIDSKIIHLKAKAGGYAALTLDSNGVVNGDIYAHTDGAPYMRAGTRTNHPFVLSTNNTQRVFITGDGNTILNEMNPVGNTLLSIVANDLAGKNCIGLKNKANTTNGLFVMFQNYASTLIGNIAQNAANTVAYNTSSDYRLKENVQPMTGALAKIKALNPVTYNWKADGAAGQGFIAHELQAVVPDCVTGEKDGEREVPTYDENGNQTGAKIEPVYQGVDTSFLVATVVKAMQEQQAQIDALEARIAKLEARP